MSVSESFSPSCQDSRTSTKSELLISSGLFLDLCSWMIRRINWFTRGTSRSHLARTPCGSNLERNGKWSDQFKTPSRSYPSSTIDRSSCISAFSVLSPYRLPKTSDMMLFSEARLMITRGSILSVDSEAMQNAFVISAAICSRHELEMAICFGEKRWHDEIRLSVRQYTPYGAKPIARLNSRPYADSLIGRLEKAGWVKISLAISGSAVTMARVSPRENAISFFALDALAATDSLRWARPVIKCMLPMKGRPLGPGIVPWRRCMERHLPQAGPPGWAQWRRAVTKKVTRNITDMRRRRDGSAERLWLHWARRERESSHGPVSAVDAMRVTQRACGSLERLWLRNDNNKKGTSVEIKIWGGAACYLYTRVELSGVLL
jgi:hypothetical protein